jgi:hypothetical protein
MATKVVIEIKYLFFNQEGIWFSHFMVGYFYGSRRTDVGGQKSEILNYNEPF